jgi:small subunit ribosomal protein S5
MAQEDTANAQDEKKGGRGNRGGGGGNRGNNQREARSKLYEEEVVRINRCDKVVKGGKRSSFSAFVVLGDGKGKVGYGYAKARQVPNSIDKAVRTGERSVRRYPIVKDTIPHEVQGRFGSAVVRLIPASEGTGVIAGKTVRAVLEKLGIHNVLTKSFGSNNPINLVKATFDALDQLRTKEQYEELRGLKI